MQVATSRSGFAGAGLVGAVGVGAARELGAGRVAPLLALAELVTLATIRNAGGGDCARSTTATRRRS